jgi:nucleotide-binding universal stress UspA family protein
MVKKILVPLDGSETAETILPHLRALLKRLDGDVLLLHVCTKSPREQEVGRAYLDGLAVRLSEQFPGIDTMLVVGKPVAKIVEVAITERVDLIAMATHGRSGLGKLLWGSVAEELLEKCPVPILLARPDAAVTDDRTILVPLDGSARAKSVLPIAVDIGAAADAKLILLTAGVYETPAHLEAAKKTLAGHGVTVKVVASREKPTPAILAAVQDEGVGLVVLATHGRTGATKRAFGSVAADLLHLLKIPVLVKRTGGLLERAGLKPRKTKMPEGTLPRHPAKYV